METTPLTLASASPRRRRLLTWLETPFEAISTDTDEDLGSSLRIVPPVLARALAAEKARAARELLGQEAAGVILAFDTIVVLDRAVLGKPEDEADAWRMLLALSGRTHQVVTGVAVFAPGKTDPETFAVTTDVEMSELDDEAIAAWLAGGEAMGCAGAYNIEAHLASVGEGSCYQNVAGLPLCHVYERLTRLGMEGLVSPVAACDAARGCTCTLGPRASTVQGV